ncbi:MAG: hypothetical protein ACYTFG_16155, partial [Planctomycetota bacterium]
MILHDPTFQTGPRGSFRGIALLIALVVLAPAKVLALEFEIRDGRARARDGDRIVWENVFDANSVVDAKFIAGPVRAGDRLYYVVGNLLYDVDAPSGVVNRVITIPGEATGLTAEGEVLSVEVGSEYTVYDWKKTYEVRPEYHDIPFVLSGSLRFANIRRMQADTAVQTILDQADTSTTSKGG